MLSGGLRPLSADLGSSVLAALEKEAPELGDLRTAISAQRNDEAIRRARARIPRPVALTQEATNSALKFFKADPSRLTPELHPEPTPFALELEEATGLIENDVIADDAVVFPEWKRSDFSSRGWWEFRYNDRKLLVKNINVSPQETSTGADLVYVRRDPDSFVLVQYKLLTPLADGKLVFRPDGRLDGQIARMIGLETSPRGQVGADDLGTYRVGPGFSFVKFVAPSDARAEKLGALAEGYYLPSEFARRLLLTPDTGPKGGKVHYIPHHRSITADMFARLVRDSWVGSTGDATATLKKLFGLRSTDTDLVLAVEEPVDGQSTDAE